MISTQDIKNKEVINIYDGKSLGFVEDIEVNLEKGTIEGIIVPEPRGFFSFFGRTGEQVIRWRDIKRIGDDVILVDVAGVLDSDYEEAYDRRGAYGWSRYSEPDPAMDFHREREERGAREQSFDRTEGMEEAESEDKRGK